MANCISFPPCFSIANLDVNMQLYQALCLLMKTMRYTATTSANENLSYVMTMITTTATTTTTTTAITNTATNSKYAFSYCYYSLLSNSLMIN